MGCCGEPYEAPEPVTEKHVVNPYPTTMQPSPHPGAQFLDKPYQTPSIPSPPPSHQFGGPNGYQTPPPAAWTPVPHSPPPGTGSPYSQFPPPGSPPPGAGPLSPQFGGMSNGPLSPQFTGTTLNGMTPNGSLQRPTPVHAMHSGSATMTTSRVGRGASVSAIPPMDEGKMSVSIDFGELRPI